MHDLAEQSAQLQRDGASASLLESMRQQEEKLGQLREMEVKEAAQRKEEAKREREAATVEEREARAKEREREEARREREGAAMRQQVLKASQQQVHFQSPRTSSHLP